MSQLLEIRPFRPGDADMLARIQVRALMAIHPRFYSRAELTSLCKGVRAERFQTLSETELLRLAADADGSVLGFCGARPEGATGAIARLFTLPEQQGRGVGTCLLRSAEADLMAAGAARATVEASLSAVAFYETRGYDALERRTRPTAGGIDLRFWYMEKTL